MSATHTTGSCLCETVEFSISGRLPDLYQCHCSECRKVTGSFANAATLVAAGDFRWLGGEQAISSFVHATGYRTDFCCRCGSPVPNLVSGEAWLWVPAGLLRQTDATVVVQLFTDAIPVADTARYAGLCLARGPESLETLLHYLDPDKPV